jgi:hypothetical protein
MGETDDDEPVLELRIHGVNNTPPTGMLDLPAESVAKVGGDDLATFWRPTSDALAKLTEHDRGYVPKGVVREAYSWGGMARNSIGGASGFQKVVGVAARVGWMLLLPFGLVNVAYWSRRLDDGPPDSEAPAPVGWRQGRGGATLRIAGLLMTLLMTTAIAVIPMDLVGVQCFASPAKPCTNLPSQVDFLATWDVGRRLALLSLVPLLVVTGLWVLATITRSSYERATGTLATEASERLLPDASAAVKRWPLLRTPGFWNHHVITSRTAMVHLAAVAVLLELITAWHIAFGTGADCVSPTAFVRPHTGCLHQAIHSGARSVTELLMVVAGVVLMLVLMAVLVRGTEEAVDVQAPDAELRQDPTQADATRRGLIAALVAAALLYCGQIGILALWRGKAVIAPRLLGISVTPAIILSLLLAVSVSALFWRMEDRRRPLLLAGLFGLLLLASGVEWREAVWCRWITVLVGLLLALWAMRFPSARARVSRARGSAAEGGGTARPRWRYEAWNGCGPGVFLLLALLMAMVLSGALVVTVGNLLNGSNSTASLAGGKLPDMKPAVSTCPATCPLKVPPQLLLPQPFVWFGVALLATLALMLVLLIVYAVRAVLSEDREIVDPRPVPIRPPSTDYTGHRRPSTQQVDQLARNARRFAQIAHRAEPVLGSIVLIGGACLTASLLVGVAWIPGAVTGVDAFANWALGAGMWAQAGVGAAVIAAAVGGTAVGGKRPLGLLWDLVCFLPRAGHPFGPPCYAERAVPELLTRYDEWFSPPPGSTERDHAAARVVISAHSLGSVIAVSTIFAAHADESALRSWVDRVSLLSYGSQLRTYFGRVFPELLGSEVLGNEPCLGAGLLNPNAQVEPQPRESPPAPGSLSRLLVVDSEVGRWRNLWRRTDYLGFAVFDASDASPVDRGAEEIDNSGYLLGVLTHSDYPRTPAYRQALDELVGGG